MRYDAVIIGGGLSAMVCGIALQSRGLRTAMVSAGQSALHFSSGSFSLLNILPNAHSVDRPLEVLDALSPSHPYSKIGSQKVREYALATPSFFAECGSRLYGDPEQNSWRHCATGQRKRAWLALEDTLLMPSEEYNIGRKALIIGIYGYLDFYSSLVADKLSSYGTECRCEQIRPAALESLLSSPSEMRSVNIARRLADRNVLKQLCDSVKGLIKDEDVVILPQVFGLENVDDLQFIKDEVGREVVFIGTMIPSVPGLRLQMQLRRRYEQTGGMLLAGDSVTGGEFSEGTLASVNTSNLGDYALRADAFVLASGSFFGRGLHSDHDGVYESIFALDVDYEHDRGLWCRRNFYSSQPYMSFGVATDSQLHPSLNGRRVENLYAVGSVLSGSNSMNEGSGAGTAIISAMCVADNICKGR